MSSPLKTLIAVETDARAFGFDWPNVEMILEQAISECAEIRDAIAHSEPPVRLQEEIGDLLHTAISLCLFAGFDVEDTLNNVSAKFARRMAEIKKLTYSKGLPNLQGQSMDYMLTLWKAVKAAE